MTFILAEAAQGHEGNETYAQHLIKAAAEAGADAVKFQLVVADDLAEPGYEYYEWYKKVEFSLEQWTRLIQYARSVNIGFVCDVFGETGIGIARELKVDAVKLHAADFFNPRLISLAYEVAPIVLLSMAGIRLHEVKQRIAELNEKGLAARTVIQCGYQAEPTPVDKTSLGRIVALRELAPGYKLGFMDHTLGDGPDNTLISAMAVALGADWLEKHLTIDRFLKFDSYVSALTPSEFADYVAQMRRAETAIGPKEYVLLDEEFVYRDKYIKKLLFGQDLAAGAVIRKDDLRLKRSGKIAKDAGFHDSCEVVGRRLKRPVLAGEPVLQEDIV